ncbi:MAG: hypothetical protein VX762_04925 [Bacteroidota bacterium]|nr:hypothetical protein [Bacteroidota bacterium]
MRKTLLIFCLFVGLNTVAQNRLEFNQVINIDTTISYSQGNSYGSFLVFSSEYEVPADKVWKVVHVKEILINDTKVEPNGDILWLGYGDKFQIFESNYCHSSVNTPGCSGIAHLFLSAIEFNLD